MIFVISCFPPVVEDKGDMFYTISDPTAQSIINAQDRRLTDSIIPYLSHQKALYRKLAANALGSFQDSLAIPHLIGLLHDDQEFGKLLFLVLDKLGIKMLKEISLMPSLE